MHLPDTAQDHDNRVADRMFADEWLPALEQVMRDWDTSWGNLPYTLPLAESTGIDCWREMFDNGLLPDDAFFEDQNSWH